MLTIGTGIKLKYLVTTTKFVNTCKPIGSACALKADHPRSQIGVVPPERDGTSPIPAPRYEGSRSLRAVSYARKRAPLAGNVRNSVGPRPLYKADTPANTPMTHQHLKPNYSELLLLLSQSIIKLSLHSVLLFYSIAGHR